MIRGLRGGLLVNALLVLGVVDLPPPRRERDEAAAAARHREVCQARRARRGEQKAARKTRARKTAGRGW